MPKILLDAGHYGNYNRSPVVPQYCEAKRMWDLHLLVKKYLEQYGFGVDLTRTNQKKDLALSKRGAKAKGYDLLLSLHSDACDSESVNRATVFYAFDDWKNASVLAKRLASKIGECMGVSGTAKTKKSTNGNWDYYSVMFYARQVRCPLYFIIEHSFHTNKASATWLMSDSNLDKLARAEAKVIAEYFGMTAKAKPISAGDLVKICNGAVWTTGKVVPSHVLCEKWYVKSINGTRAVVDENESGTRHIMSPIDTKYLTVTSTELEEGDRVKMSKDATVYGQSKKFSDFVYASTLYVRGVDGNRVVVSTQKIGAVTGPVHKKYLTKI